MFILDKQKDKAVLTVYGYVGGYYLDYRNIAAALDDITRSQLKQVDLHIHTNGGNVFDGNLIYNFIANFKGIVDIYIDGIAASMGSVIIMAGERVHIAENGFIMIHSPSGEGSGNARQLLETAKLLRSIETNFVSKFAQKTGKTAEEIRSKYFDGNDHWIDADEAVALKLATSKFTARSGNLTFTKADAMKQGLSGIFDKYTAAISQPKPDFNMSKVTMKLKLNDDAPEQEVVSAIEALEQRATTAEAQLTVYQQKEKDSKKDQAEKLVEAAIKDQRISALGKPEWLAMFENNFESAEKVLASIPKRTTAQESVEKGAESESDNLLKMSWAEIDKANMIMTLKTKYPEAYKEKFKAEFGVEPKL